MTQLFWCPESSLSMSLPDDPDTPIWRYMDFTKYVSLLVSQKLWFARADVMQDKFEGSSTLGNKAWLAQALTGVTNASDMLAIHEALTRAMVANTAMSCWHMGAHESAAMWDLYLSSSDGLAVRSTVSRLRESFQKGNARGSGRTPDSGANALPIHMGAVKYIDYTNQAIPPGNLLWPFFHKRKSYEHEHELRALVQDAPVTTEGDIDPRRSWLPEGGVSAAVDLNTLIDSVYVAPRAATWFAALVRTVSEQSAFRFPVVQSSLADDPIY